MELKEFAGKWFSEDAGKTVPLDLLRAWLSEHHYHTEEGDAYVLSMDMDRWAREVAE